MVSIITCNEHKVATGPTFYEFDHGTSAQSAVTTTNTTAATAGATLLRPALKALMTNYEHTRHSCGRTTPWDCRVLMDSQQRAEGDQMWLLLLSMQPRHSPLASTSIPASASHPPNIRHLQ